MADYKMLDFDDVDYEEEEEAEEKVEETHIKEMTLVEKFDKHKLKYLLDNKEKFMKQLETDYDPFSKPEEYLNISENGEIKVKYSKSSIDGMGRLFASKSLSLQNFKCKIRHTIASDYYDDIDMVNAHPVILQHLCKKNNLEHTQLTTYIEKRDECIKDVCEKNKNCDRGVVKKCVLSLINGGDTAYKVIKNKTIWLTSFKNEIEFIKEELAKKYQSFFNRVEKYKNSNSNYKDSALNIMFCDIEHKILMSMVRFFRKKKIMKDTAVLCFDGVMIPKGVPKNAIDECAKYASEKIGFEIKLSVKPMDKGFILPDDIPKYNEICGITANDPFVWIHFDQKYRGVEFDSIGDCVRKTAYDLRRVLARVEKGRGFYVKKTDCNGGLFDVVNAGASFTDLYFWIKDSKKDSKKHSKKLRFIDYLQVSAMKLYKSIDFLPENKDKEVFNLFTGYKAKVLKKWNKAKIKLPYEHIRDVICGGDEESFHYFMRYWAHVLMKPAVKTGVVIWLYSKTQGTGKNSIFNFFSKHIIGDSLCREIAGLQPLCEKHNTILMGRKLLIVNEARDRSNTFFSNFDKLKTLITDSKIFIDPKGKDGFDLQNNIEIVISSNHVNSIVVERSDRRYFCLEVNDSKAGKKEYFKNLYKSFTDDAGDHFLTFLVQQYGSNERLDDPPINDIKKKLIDLSEPSPRRFIRMVKEAIKEKSDDDDHIHVGCGMNLNEDIRGQYIYDCYKSWCSEVGLKSMSKMAFDQCISDERDKMKVRRHNNRVAYRIGLLT